MNQNARSASSVSILFQQSLHNLHHQSAFRLRCDNTDCEKGPDDEFRSFQICTTAGAESPIDTQFTIVQSCRSKQKPNQLKPTWRRHDCVISAANCSSFGSCSKPASVTWNNPHADRVSEFRIKDYGISFDPVTSFRSAKCEKPSILAPRDFWLPLKSSCQRVTVRGPD